VPRKGAQPVRSPAGNVKAGAREAELLRHHFATPGDCNKGGLG
jgi:hypothetical protein